MLVAIVDKLIYSYQLFVPVLVLLTQLQVVWIGLIQQIVRIFQKLEHCSIFYFIRLTGLGLPTLLRRFRKVAGNFWKMIRKFDTICWLPFLLQLMCRELHLSGEGELIALVFTRRMVKLTRWLGRGRLLMNRVRPPKSFVRAINYLLKLPS